VNGDIGLVLAALLLGVVIVGWQTIRGASVSARCLTFTGYVGFASVLALPVPNALELPMLAVALALGVAGHLAAL
jgi:hypothetical protein